jgi:hypothetical protein
MILLPRLIPNDWDYECSYPAEGRRPLFGTFASVGGCGRSRMLRNIKTEQIHTQDNGKPLHIWRLRKP